MSALGSAARGLVLATCAGAALALVWYALQDAEHARLRSEALARLAAARHERIATLEQELAAALAANDGVRAFVQERARVEARERAAREERLRAATKPLPEGLRLAIETLHDVLRRSGHARLRVLALAAIEDKEMRGLELFEAPDDNGGGTTLWQAGRAVARLDRAKGTLTLKMFDGHVVRLGQRTPLPDDGDALVLHGVDGVACEDRLPYLVVGEGEYPAAVPKVPPTAKLDPFSAQSWRTRLNELLATAQATTRWRVNHVDGLADAHFLGVVLLGAAGKRVEQMAEVERLAIVVDEAAGTVELELIGGVLRRTHGEITLPAAAPGQRILLPGVTPQAASLGLTGMVVRR
jgi:hypothetical protein